MKTFKKNILAICGSTRENSTNLQLIHAIGKLTTAIWNIEIYDGLALLPHFNPDLDKDSPPPIVDIFRNKIRNAAGILICTPDYIFSLPGSLKNAIEWTVSTTLFSKKPAAIITASGLGEKAHESLQLIMKTIEAEIPGSSQLLIRGARNKVNDSGEITDETTLSGIKELIRSFTATLSAD